MIVTLFEEALNMHMSSPIDLLYLGGSITLIALAQYLSHAADHDSNKEYALETSEKNTPPEEKR